MNPPFKTRREHLAALGETISAGEYKEYMEKIYFASRSVGPFFEEYDVLLTPTTARPAPKVGEIYPTKMQEILAYGLSKAPTRKALYLALDEMAKTPLSATPNTQLFNITGQPAISLPTHWTNSDIPVGTQWIGRFGDEATLLRLAGQIELARPWKDRKPPFVK